MLDANPFDDLEQCLTEPLTIVGIADLGEAEQGVLGFPLPRSRLINPVPSYCEVSVRIASLPGITGDADLASHSRTLDEMLARSGKM